MLNVIIYQLIAALTVYIAIIYNSSELYLLFLLEIVWFAVNLILLFYQWRKVEFALHFPLAVVEKNQPVVLEGIIHNRGRIPVTAGKICLRYRIFGKKKPGTIVIQGFASAGMETVLESRLEGLYSGSYFFDQAVVKLYDPLRLFYLKKQIRQHERLDVMPQIYNAAVAVPKSLRQFQGDSEIYDSLHGGNDASEMFQIRDFREGDKLKDIHWKLSAKSEEWMVRESSQPLPCAVVIFLDFSEDAKRKKHMYHVDALISTASSISFELVENKCPHYIAWISKKENDVVRVRVDNEESLYLFLASIYQENAVTEKRDLKQIYQDKYKGETYLSFLEINSKLELIVKGDKLANLHPQTLEKELEETEIIL